MKMTPSLRPVSLSCSLPTQIDGKSTEDMSDGELLEIIQREQAKQHAAEAMHTLNSDRITAAAFALRESVQRLVNFFDARGEHS